MHVIENNNDRVSGHIQSQISRIFGKITVFTGMFISPLPSNYDHQLVTMVIYNERFPSINSHDPLITWFVRSRNKVRTLRLYYQSVHGHQTWQNGDLPWRAPKHNGHVVFWSHVTNENHYIFTTTTRVSIATKIGKMVTYLDGHTHKDTWPLIAWTCKIMW